MVGSATSEDEALEGKGENWKAGRGLYMWHGEGKGPVRDVEKYD